MSNRLELDFALQTNEERTAFVDSYLQSPQFISSPLTSEETETIANYILWGKNPRTGLNGKQEGLYLETKNKTWDSDHHVESLDALMESPTFNENALVPHNTQYKNIPLKFDRERTLKFCPPEMRSDFETLFAAIDRTELLINFWELQNGKRTKPPREELVERFSPDQIESLKLEASTWTSRTYMRQRHYLVELRRDQYGLRDSYHCNLRPSTDPQLWYEDPDPAELGDEIEILPLGAFDHSDLAHLIFQKNFCPSQMRPSDLETISNFLWRKKSWKPEKNQQWFDFCNEEHLYRAMSFWQELDEQSKFPSATSASLRDFVETFEFYAALAELTEPQREILQLKIEKKSNRQICEFVNEKYGKKYNENYISTIFKQKIIPRIAEAVKNHLEEIENLFFPEEFKLCPGCGKTLLLRPRNFTRKTKSPDGFMPRCKKCEKLARKLGGLKNVIV